MNSLTPSHPSPKVPEGIDRSAPWEQLSDESIRGILRSFAPGLHRTIGASHPKLWLSSAKGPVNAVPMLVHQLEGWERLFGIRELVVARAPSLLVIEDEQPSTGRRIESSEHGAPSPVRALAVRGGSGFRALVNVPQRDGRDIRAEYPLVPFNLEQSSLTWNCYGHLGGDKPGQLYNAFIAVDVFAHDKFGRLAYHHIPGTYNTGWSRVVYGHERIASLSCWFNTSIAANTPNSLAISWRGRDGATLSCAIHDIAALPTLEISRDPEVRFFFWLVEQYRDTCVAASATTRHDPPRGLPSFDAALLPGKPRPDV